MIYRITFAVVHSERHKFFLTFVNDESYYDMFLLSRILVTLAKDFSQCHFYDKQLIINDVCKVFGTLIKLLSCCSYNSDLLDFKMLMNSFGIFEANYLTTYL